MASRPLKLHVLGGGLWQVPTIRLARSLGHEVLVTDLYQERPGYALASAHEVIDITDRERTLEAARRHKIDGILCDTTDVGVPTAAYVAEQLGLPGPGYEVALNFTNKGRMRTITRDAGLSPVQFHLATNISEVNEAAKDLGYPLVVKPVDSQSSRGVHRVDGPEPLMAGFHDALRFSRSGQVLAEEFLPGTEATVEGFCLDGRYVTTGVSDKGHFVHRPEVANRLTYPANFDDATMGRLRSLNESVVRTLGLRNGVTHAEYMVHEGEVRLVEIAARGGGSLIHSDIVTHLSGIDVPRATIELALGIRPNVIATGEPRAANLAFLEFPPGVVTAIDGAEEARRLPGVHTLLLEFALGDAIRPPEDDRSRPGMVVVFGSTREEVLETTDVVKNLVRVTVR